ncbi:MAG TPA: hypothetical protein VGF94_08155 [Kofleriaceae bacterium]|jgi:hypothetical protein
MQMYDSQENIPKGKTLRALLKGTGAAAPSLLAPSGGVTIARPALGRVVVTWAEDPGTFLGFGYAYGDPTTANVKGWSAVRTAYSNANGVFTIEVDLYSSTFALVDLPATSFLDLEFNFAWSNAA